MNIRQLEAFKTIMELGSFTRAAEKLNLSQPAVSKLIYLLEKTCGFLLFHRQKNGVVPTAEGEMLHSEVQRVFLSVESVAARAKAIKHFNYGQINVVSFPSLAARVLPPIIGDFLADRSGLKIEIWSRNSWLLVEAVATQGFDLGFGMFSPDRPGVSFEKLCTMRAVCVLPPDHPLAEKDVIHAHDLHGQRFIGMVDEDRAQLEIDRIFAECGSERELVIKAQLTEMCCSFAAAGVGVSIVDPLSTEGFARSALVVKPFRPVVTANVWVVMPTFREPSLGTKALIAHVKRGLTARIAEMERAIGDVIDV